METMQLGTDPTTIDLTLLDDDALEALFLAAGLHVHVVAHCDDAGCTACFPSRGRAQAA